MTEPRQPDAWLVYDDGHEKRATCEILRHTPSGLPIWQIIIPAEDAHRIRGWRLHGDHPESTLLDDIDLAEGETVLIGPPIGGDIRPNNIPDNVTPRPGTGSSDPSA